MRVIRLTMSAVAASGAVVLGLAEPAAAAQEPDEQASCLAKVFQAQAVDPPQTVSNRILEIREFLLQGDEFGQVLKPLAQGTFEHCP